MPFTAPPNLVPEIITHTSDRLSDDIRNWFAEQEKARQQSNYSAGVSLGLGSPSDKPIGAVLAEFGRNGQTAASTPEGLQGFLQGYDLQRRGAEDQARLDLQQNQFGFVPTPADFDRADKAGYALLPTGHGRYRAVQTAGGPTNEPAFTPSPEQIDQASKVGLTWLPTSRGQGRWVQDSNHPVNVPPAKPAKGAPQDSLELLDKDVQAISGAPLSTFINGTNHRIEGDKFVVDGVGVGAAGARMPVPMFERFRTRYNAITGLSDGSVNSGVQPPGAAPLTNGSGSQRSGLDPSVVLSQARAKIQAGADPNAVKARLQQLGVDPSGL